MARGGGGMKETAMECTGFDWKGYALGELSAADTAECDRHAQACERCRTELAQYRATVSGLRRLLPQVEPPRRIVFTPEPVEAASWWRRMWQSSPQLGFASAAVLALAIVAHALLARVPAAPAPAQTAQIEVRVHEEAQKEIARRLPQAVDAAVERRFRDEIRPALAKFNSQMLQGERLRAAGFEQKRDSDLKTFQYAFTRLEQRLNYAVLSSTRPNGGE
jgi:anti-sigma factor RsiW